MQQVPRAVRVVHMNGIEPAMRHGWVGDHVRPDGREFPEDTLDVRRDTVNAVVGMFRSQWHPLQRPNVKDFIRSALRARTHCRAFASWRSTADKIHLN